MMMMIKIFVNIIIIIIGYLFTRITVFTLKNTPKEHDSLERKQKAKNS
jgi:uncharacterized membrane protein